MNLRIVIGLSLFITVGSAYKVLFLAPVIGKSHFLFMQTIVRALLEKGHEVSYVTSNTLSHLNLKNYTEYLVFPSFDFDDLVPPDKLFNTDGSPFATVRDLMGFAHLWNRHHLESENVQRLINSTGLNFDIVINEEFFADSLLMFAHKFNAPVVTICTFGYADHIDRQVGLPSLYSVSSHWTLPFTDQMTFYQRWYNTLVNIYDWYVRNYVFLPAETEYAQKYFGHLGPLPSINDLIRNISMVLVNTHRAIFPPRASMPNVVSIGGAHIKPTKPLPKDIQDFLDGAKHGAIFFSLGTVINSSALPKEKIQLFLDTFKTLKQRVLWKFEDETLPNVPSNVIIRKWMPQNDILAHKNILLFIGHGGLFGTTEALYHGRPLLLIPFFSDQHRNAHRVDMEGYGKFLSFGEMTRESLRNKINEIISNESFRMRAEQTSAVFKDNLVHPLDEAVWWIEHVAKFRGAKHLKSHAVDMPWFSYLLFDVIAVNLLIVSVVLYAIYYLIRKILPKQKTTEETASKKQK